MGKMVPVEVMTVSSSYSSSAWITLCQTHQVRKDLSCSCECPITKHNCTGHQQIFLPHQCRCLCQNRYAHTECLNAGRQWDPSSCSCLCSSWQTCSTGFLFDTSSCSCVATVTHLRGSLPFLLLVILVVVSVVGVVSGLLVVRSIREKRDRRESQALVW